MTKAQQFKVRVVATYIALNGTLTVSMLTWWALLLWDWVRTREGALGVGLVALGIAVNSALVCWLVDYCLGWGWDDEDDGWEDPEPVTLPPLKDLMGGGR